MNRSRTLTARPARRHRLGVAVVAIALTLTACGGSSGADGTSGSGDGPSEGADGAAASDDAFPVTIEGTLGSTTIEERPERVVTLGWGANDIAVALGVIPVGMEIDEWGGDEEGYTPWFRAAVEEAGAELPETIQMYPELDIDAVVALEPDLVLAPQSGLEQDVYDQLSEFTQVVAYPGIAWQTPWREHIEIAGQALGLPDEAAAAIEETEGYFAEAAAEHPELADYDFAYIYAGNEPGALSSYVGDDTRVEFLTELGMPLDPGVADLTADDGTFVATLGLENVDVLDDVDLLFTWFNDAAERESTEAQPLYAQIPAVERDSYVVIDDTAVTRATTVTNPLTVPWVLDDYIAEILAAAERV